MDPNLIRNNISILQAIQQQQQQQQQLQYSSAPQTPLTGESSKGILFQELSVVLGKDSKSGILPERK